MSERIDNDDEVAAVTENTPLVWAADNSTSAWKPGHSRSSTLTSVTSAAISLPTAHKPGAVLALLCLIIFAGSTADAFKQIPMTRIFEDILCHEYYGKTPVSSEPIDEALCKDDVIQSRLAYLLAGLEALTSGMSCLVALLWGIVADRVGRKPVYAASSIGMIIHLLITMIVGWFSDTLSPRLLWTASIGHLLGGAPVMTATIYSILSDVIPESNRAISFMRIHVSSLVGNLVSPALASLMMSSTGPWPVMLVTLILWILATAMVALIPETFHRKLTDDNADDDTQSHHNSFKTRAYQGLNQLRDSLFIVTKRSVALVICICILSFPVIMCTLQFMIQFISKRYHIPLAKTGYVQSIYGVAHIVAVLSVVPFVSSLVVKPTLPKWLRVSDEKTRDLVLVRWSFAASMIGTFVLSIAPSLPVFVAGLLIMSLGSGSASFIKSIGASHVDTEHRSRLFTIIGLSEMASNIWSTPALAALFTLGMRLGGQSIGLPYLGVSFICLVMLVLSLFVQPATTDSTDEESSPEHQPILERND
ncbi:MFS general substrate transporter [Hypoxylon trugodes]|uniref:MFS general substrate transporter n=1 Tax=Hypoxylon trugodes TaxID=326681 RepID=UPI0021923596|nr:MFS general substrate transporter [Hypoxylon trugodes]KAI1385432.1 MFS general substrate transporter [Hypoxylon trugodes]